MKPPSQETSDLGASMPDELTTSSKTIVITGSSDGIGAGPAKAT